MEEHLTQLFNGTITRTPQLIKVWMLIQASANILDYDPHWQGFDGENMEKIRQQRPRQVFDRRCCPGSYCRYGCATSLMVRLNEFLTRLGGTGLNIHSYPLRTWAKTIIARSYAGTRCFCHPCPNCYVNWVPDHIRHYRPTNNLAAHTAESNARAGAALPICTDCAQEPPLITIGINEWLHTVDRYPARLNWDKLRRNFWMARLTWYWFGLIQEANCGPDGKYRKRDRQAFEADGEEGA